MPKNNSATKRSNKQSSFEQLNQKRAAVIEEIMRLRHEQARLKTQLVKEAVTSGRPELVTNIVMCW